jgi:hypothetical protein
MTGLKLSALSLLKVTAFIGIAHLYAFVATYNNVNSILFSRL